MDTIMLMQDERESLSADGAASGNNSQFESPPRPGTGQLLDLNSMALRQETIDDLVRGSSMSMQEQQPHQTLQLQPSSASLREHCLADTGADAQRNLQTPPQQHLDQARQEQEQPELDQKREQQTQVHSKQQPGQVHTHAQAMDPSQQQADKQQYRHHHLKHQQQFREKQMQQRQHGGPMSRSIGQQEHPKNQQQQQDTLERHQQELEHQKQQQQQQQQQQNKKYQQQQQAYGQHHPDIMLHETEVADPEQQQHHNQVPHSWHLQKQQQQQQPDVTLRGVGVEVLQQSQHQKRHQAQQLWQQQKSHHLQQPQAQVRGEADRWKNPMLSGYVPPAAYTHVNVPALMEQTSAAIARWADLQKTLDVKSDAATTNLAAQAEVRSSLKRDLTNLTQLADAQTKHIQRVKLRQMQVMQSMKSPAQGGFSGGLRAQAQTSMPIAASMGPGVVSGSVSATDALKLAPNKPQDVSSSGISSAVAMPATPTTSSPRSSSSIVAGLMQQSGGGPGGAQASFKTSRPEYTGEVRAGGRPSEWPSATTTSSPPPALMASPSPPLPMQHSLPTQQRLHVVKQKLDRTDPRNKWAVLIDASLQLLPHEGSTFKQFFVTIQGFLNSYNGAGGTQVAQALQSCLDPRVFDPMDIKRSQEKMADVYSQWTNRGQR